MIAVKLQKLLQASSSFSIVAKFRDLIFKQIVWFQTQSVLFFNWIGFEPQAHFFNSMICMKSFRSELKAHFFRIGLFSNSKRNLKKDSYRWGSNFALFGFGLQATHVSDSNNIVEVRALGALFLTIRTPLSPNIKNCLFCVTNGILPIREKFLIPWLMPWFFNHYIAPGYTVNLVTTVFWVEI